jgi:two-component system, NtrC family, sensor kinase
MGVCEIALEKAGGAVERYPVTIAGLTLGRGEENTITLHSKHVSRQHARFWLEDGSVHVEDLGSRNGVEVNEGKVSSAALNVGDQITIGGHRMSLVEAVDSGFGRTVISSAAAKALQESILLDANDERLLVLYKAAQLLGELFDLDELLEKILALIFEAVPVERGFVLTLTSGDKRPEVRAAQSRGDKDDGPPLSQTLIRHVFIQGEAILTNDAQDDSRFGKAESIMGHDIHAAMCAPLHGRNEVAGVIYVDVGDSTTSLSDSDLELLTAIARVVGVAVENARLYRENMERERLAAIGMATAGLGHCIKNILTAIRGGAQFVNIAIEREDFNYLRRGWPILSRAIERIDMLVMNMLVFSRDRVPARSKTDINGILRDVLGMFEERANKYDVGLELEPDAVGIANVDGQAIYRVIVNLVVNAVEACEHNKGNIRLTCACDEQGCTIRVIDSGIGIPEEILPQLSQVFVSSKGGSGTGLGLACSYKIVREHGGEIQVKSAVGEGTVFTVFLPVVEADGGEARKTLVQRRGIGG